MSSATSSLERARSTSKGHGNLVTDADRAAERVEALRSRFLTHGGVGPCHVAMLRVRARADATEGFYGLGERNDAHGVPHFCVSLATQGALARGTRVLAAATFDAFATSSSRRLRGQGCHDQRAAPRCVPFEADWSVITSKLEEAPEVEAKTIFEELLGQHPERYHQGQLRTLQRKVRDWHALKGEEQEVFFAQNHKPGVAMQTDFTWCTKLLITIAGEAFDHMLCHVVLPYSNWAWATVCQSESMASLRRGIQAAAFKLGRVPRWNQTDNSTAATHNLSAAEEGVKRPFNREYLGLMRHLGMEPRTIEVGESNQNGDVEALNGALKRRLLQHLLVRGHRDFESVTAYETWVQGVVTKANGLRTARLAEELAVMRPLSVERLAEYREEDVLVTSWSTIRVKHNAYSVPSRLIGHWVQVRLFDDRLEVSFRNEDQLVVERLSGRNGRSINYRHIIWSLVQKPGAFELYRYREDLFPSLIFRLAYDSLLKRLELRKADIEYLRILHLAASTMEADVEVALGLLLESGGVKSAEQVKTLGAPVQLVVPTLEVPKIDLSIYDALLTSGVGT